MSVLKQSQFLTNGVRQFNGSEWVRFWDENEACVWRETENRSDRLEMPRFSDATPRQFNIEGEQQSLPVITDCDMGSLLRIEFYLHKALFSCAKFKWALESDNSCIGKCEKFNHRVLSPSIGSPKIQACTVSKSNTISWLVCIWSYHEMQKVCEGLNDWSRKEIALLCFALLRVTSLNNSCPTVTRHSDIFSAFAFSFPMFMSECERVPNCYLPLVYQSDLNNISGFVIDNFGFDSQCPCSSGSYSYKGGTIITGQENSLPRRKGSYHGRKSYVQLHSYSADWNNPNARRDSSLRMKSCHRRKNKNI
jgi:hypothetical protein